MAPTEEATPENVQAYNTHSDDNNFATYDACNMSHELEKLHEGMDAYTNIYHSKRAIQRCDESDKLEAKSDKCLFVGYPKETVGYYFYNPIEMKVIISKHVVFLDEGFILKDDNGSKVDLEEVQETINKIDQLDVPMAELASDEVQIGKVGTTSSQRHTSSA
ncbi:Uncharacterized protein Adt_02978 [Abeliophyllum distichum]|uniref:Retroviral polymerase SH3-like domain-containing protein n=1 Tax=Abeliophyllum distichum TaxID=126358 RepID=A0ABD1W0J5_9LAMI